MDLLNTFNDPNLVMDCSLSIIQEANKNGFFGFSGFCGQAALLINECLFDNNQTIFAAFNKSLEHFDHHIGHVACLIDLPYESYFIIDSDAQIKSIDDIESWGMLDSSDQDYIKLFKSYSIPINDENFESVITLTLTKDFVFQHFNCEHINEQRIILQEAITKVLPLFLHKNNKFNPKIK